MWCSVVPTGCSTTASNNKTMPFGGAADLQLDGPIEDARGGSGAVVFQEIENPTPLRVFKRR